MLLIPLALATEMDRAPYLQTTSDSSTHIVWWTVGESDGQVFWGPAGGELSETATSTTGAVHVVELSGLDPSTSYDYRVEDLEGEVLGEGSFTTNPPVGEAAPLRLWVIGDSGTGKEPQVDNYTTFKQATAYEQPPVMLHMGDIAYFGGTHDEFSDNFFAIYADFLAGSTVWPTMGNHEAFNSQSEDQSGPYFEAFVLPTAGELGGIASGTEAYYSFDLANVHVVVLDSSDTDRSADGAMAQWLEQDLAATTQEWVIATFHHPPYSKGSHDSDEENIHVEMRENLVPILEAGGVDLVMGGHSHIYERSYLLDGAYDTPTTDAGILSATDGNLEGDGPYQKPDGLTANAGAIYVVAGHGGTHLGGDGGHPVMYFHELDWGNVLVDVHDDHLTLRNLRMDGEYTDEFTLVKGDDLVLHGPDGQEDFEPGEEVEIAWTMIGELGTVDVEWTCDGETWEVIAEDLSDSTTWTVPERGTRQARVRVSAGEEVDTSDAPFGIVQTTTESPIEWGATWRYSDTDGELPADWMGNSYDDSGWSEGAAELGMGDGDEVTELTWGQPSYYFRHTFTAPEGQLEDARLTMLYDDAVAAWLNGEFVVFSANMGSTDYEAYANYASADNKVLEFDLDPERLRAGEENVLAVIVKQADEESTDLSFDLELQVDVVDPLPDCDGQLDTGDSADTEVPPDSEDSDPDSSPEADDSEPSGDTDDPRKPYDPGGCCEDGSAPAAAVGVLLLLLAAGYRRRR